MTNENTSQRSIFIADHTGQFCSLHVNYLNTCGFNVITANNKASAFRKFRKAQPNIILIHEMFPEVDLHRIIKVLQTYNKKISIILIVSNHQTANVVAAFHRGASDCVSINIDPISLVQRIQCCLTTLAPGVSKIPLSRALFLPYDFQILCDTGERINLLPKESQLLFLLCNKFGEICANEELINALWGHKNLEKKLPPSHWQMNLSSLMYSLKQKVKNLNYVCVENISKIGYRLRLF